MNFLRKFSASSMKEKMKPFIAQYGKITVYTYLGISFADLAFWYIVVQNGMDVKKVIQKFGIKIDEEKFKKSSKLGNFMIALIIHKATVPIRLPICLGCVPFVARVFGRTKHINKL